MILYPRLNTVCDLIKDCIVSTADHWLVWYNYAISINTNILFRPIVIYIKRIIKRMIRSKVLGYSLSIISWINLVLNDIIIILSESVELNRFILLINEAETDFTKCYNHTLNRERIVQDLLISLSNKKVCGYKTKSC